MSVLRGFFRLLGGHISDESNGFLSAHLARAGVNPLGVATPRPPEGEGAHPADVRSASPRAASSQPGVSDLDAEESR